MKGDMDEDETSVMISAILLAFTSPQRRRRKFSRPSREMIFHGRVADCHSDARAFSIKVTARAMKRSF